MLAGESLRLGDKVDLKSCPYLRGHSSAEFEYAEVCYAERETPTCVVVGYEGIDNVGSKPGTTLLAKKRRIKRTSLQFVGRRAT